MTDEEQKLADTLLGEAEKQSSAYSGCADAYETLMRAVKLRVEAEQTEVVTFGMMQGLDRCELCGDFI